VIPDLLLLICDTARADAFAPWGGPDPNPFLEQLAGQGVAYRRAISQAPWTLPSTASLLTGVTPSEHGVTARAYGWRDHKPTSPAGSVKAYAGSWLPEALRERGYSTWGVSCNPWLTRWGGFDRGLDELVEVRPWPPIPDGRWSRKVRRVKQAFGPGDHGGREAFDVFARWLASRDARPRFAMVNIMEMHEPYDPPLRDHPALRRRSGVGLPNLVAFVPRQLQQVRFRDHPDPAYLACIRSLYQAQARYAERLIRRFVEAFADGGRPVVVAVVSDHGENLGDHGLFAHHSSLHESLLHVPLILWGRSVDVGRGWVEEPVALQGLAAWFTGWADGNTGSLGTSGPVESEYEGTERHIGITPELHALADRIGRERLPALLTRSGLAVRERDLKYVALDDGGESLYDLEADPGEERDVSADHPEVVTRLRPFADRWRARIGGEQPAVAGELPEDEIADHLRSLGYIE
jgi:arylsulfatase A-like enzyme